MTTFTAADLTPLFGFAFSERQVAAITAPLEPSVIMAGAGSGKTSVMTARIVWLVANELVEPDRVLGLTFTNKAAAEFRTRVRHVLTQLDLAPDLADATTITTYHAFAQQLLRDDGIRIGLEPDVLLLSDVRREQLALRVVRNPRIDIRRLKTQSKALVTQVLELEDALAEEAVSPAELRAFDADLVGRLSAHPQQKIGTEMIDAALRRQELVALVEQFRELKLTSGAIDYPDMVRLGLRLVTERSDVVERLRTQYGVVLLDEYQDTSVAQRLLMVTAFGDGHPVTAVGDALQAIYEWRGASAQNIVAFPEHFPRRSADGSSEPSTVFGLPTTQRFGSGIASLANDLTAGIRVGLAGVEPVQAETDATFGSGSAVTALHADGATEFAWLAEQLRAESEHTSWGRMAVLLRVTRHAGEIYEALTAAGIPAQIVSKQALLEVPDIAELVAYLRVIHEPAANPSWIRILSGQRYRVGVRDLVHLGQRARAIASHANDRRADSWQEQLASSARGTDPVDLIAIEDAIVDPGDAPISAEGRQRISRLRDEIRRLRRYAAAPLADLLRIVSREIGLEIELTASDRARERARASAVEQFIELASQFESLEQTRSLSAFLQWLADADHLNNAVKVEPLLRRDAVSIMTVHAAKGLQREVIALPAMYEGSFPTLRSDGSWPRSATQIPFALLRTQVDSSIAAFPRTDTPTAKEFDAFQAACRPANIAEETRLAYVAVTRAHRRIIASAARSYTGRPSVEPSRFLLQIRDACEGGLGTVDCWADTASEVPEESRRGEFPQQLEPGYAQRLQAVVSELRNGVQPVDGLSDAEQAQVAEWDVAIEHHRLERLERRGALHDVPIPAALTTTQVQALAADPDAFLQDIVRPMPKQPAQAAKRGSAFHMWVEQFFGQQHLPLDDGYEREPDGVELEALKEHFLASEWAGRQPLLQEMEFTIAVGRHSVRGRIDAVYREADRLVVVDWKTNRRKDADPLQLAVYRLAAARRFGVPIEQVSACFFYVALGETVWAEADADVASVLARSAP